MRAADNKTKQIERQYIMEITDMHMTASTTPEIATPGKFALTLTHFGGAFADISTRYIVDWATASRIIDLLKATQSAGSRRAYNGFELVRIGDRAFMMLIPTTSDSSVAPAPLPINLLRSLPLVDRAAWCPYGLSNVAIRHTIEDADNGRRVVFVQIY